MNSPTYKQLFSIWCERKGLDIKDHQLDGIDWVIAREISPEIGPPGGFICDEMGLGKTILTIAAMVLNPSASKQHTLIVLPKTLLEQWSKAILRFIGIEPLVYHGSGVNKITKTDLTNAQIVVTTYGMVATRKTREYQEEFKSPLWEKKWSRIIFDEAHYLRNHKTGIFKGARLLNGTIKWMVTGTPINNKRRDFYNQSIIQGVGKCFTPKVEEIRAIINEVVLKRTKKEIGIVMPNLIENIIEVEWQSKEEERFVRNIHSLMNFVPVTAQNVDRVIQNLGTYLGKGISWLMLMRQSCVFPQLAQEALQRRAQKAGYDTEPIDAGLTDSKMSTVVNEIVKRKKSGKSKLVFCMFRKEMEHLKKELWLNGIGSATINGSTTKKQRRAALQAKMNMETREIMIQKLKNSHEHILNIIDSYLQPEVLIAQIQTCCEGLNLQHFSEVYFTTPHWNPAVEYQAIARAHRIGQEKEVEVFRFVTTFTNPVPKSRSISLDQYCIEIQKKKRECAIECGL